ncbi:MAG: SDR family oxidoreductase [Proteobacteria bacterium]|nr:SDR family oxidoreductase [Pseudomonadota bacterium]
MDDLWGYRGKTVVIDGASSGMGLAATKLLLELGADIYALDVNEPPVTVKKYIHTDLGDKSSIDAAVEQLPNEVRALFCCAGLPGAPFPDIDVVMVNFVGHRHLIEKVIPRMNPQEGAIAIISSLAGAMWRFHGLFFQGLLDTADFDEAKAWVQANTAKIKTAQNGVEGGYAFSKECICAYARHKAIELAQKGLRLNVLSPAATETPMFKHFRNQFGDALDQWKVGRFATPEDMARPLVFLNSSMAGYISGQDLMVDNGLSAIMEFAPIAQG